jgi:hypothetical protein
MRSLRSLLVAFFLVALLLAAGSAALGAASPNVKPQSSSQRAAWGPLLFSKTNVHASAPHKIQPLWDG